MHYGHVANTHDIITHLVTMANWETNYIIFENVEILSPQKISKKKINWGWKIENRREYSGIFCSSK